METTKLSKSINNLKEYGDAVKIASVVNAQRTARGDKKISPAYVRMMLNGNRKLTEEVKTIAHTYYEVQKKAQEEFNQAFAN